jgi:hypothetical protein
MMLAHARPAPFPLARFAPTRHPRCERIVLITGTHYNLNLREYYEARFGEPRADDVVHFIAHRAVFLSRSPDLPAVKTGIWPERPISGVSHDNAQL